MTDQKSGWTPSGFCSIFVCDVVAFGDPQRNDGAQEYVHLTLYRILRQSFNEAAVPFEGCYIEDRGDGVIVIPPPETDLETLVSPLVDILRTALRHHNRWADGPARIGLRVALHAGRLTHDGAGLVGKAIVHVHRILEAAPFKDAVLRVPHQFGLIVSEPVFDAIRHGPGQIDPAEYEQIDVKVKQTVTVAWMRVPGNGSAEVALTAPEAPAEIPSRPTVLADLGPDAEIRLTGPVVIDLAGHLMNISALSTPEGRQDLVNALRTEIAMRVPRRSQPHLDLQSILATCLEFPGGLHEFLTAVDLIAGNTSQVRHLFEKVAEHLSQ